jgi:hypothetical protein
MSYPINYPTPQNANVQIFYGSQSGSANDGSITQDWVKPQGASFVWFTLIGAGGNGNGAGTGGGSGSITNFMCPAFLIPDRLTVYVGESFNGSNTQIVYQEKDTAGYQLLAALTGTTTTGGSAVGQNAFAAMGFYQSIAGQNGGSTVAASGTTFLSGGGTSAGTSTSNYGYSSGPVGVGTNRGGFFQFQPIIVSTGGFGTLNGGVGSGGGDNGKGGNGLVVIITW